MFFVRVCHLGLGEMECADVGCGYVAIIDDTQHKTPVILWEDSNAHTHTPYITQKMLKRVANTIHL